VLLGHSPLAGHGSNDRYLVYGNFFYQNQHESLFQGEGNIALYNNLFVNHSGDAVRIRPHNDTVREISVFYNTVVAAGAGITLARKEDDPPYQQWIEANAIFARAPFGGAASHGNLVGNYAEAAEYLAKPYAPLGELNLLPNGGAIFPRAGDHSPFRTFPEAELDFEGDLHGTTEWGAYAPHKKQPRWLPTLEIIPVRAKR
jgi:hypothetical protein